MRLSIRVALVVILVLALAGTARAGFGVILPKGPDPAVKKWPHWPYETICGETPFDPVGVFSGETVAEHGAGEPEAALRSLLAETLDTGLPTRFWRPVTLTENSAEFASGRLSTVPYLLTFGRVGGRWAVVKSGSCRPHTVRDGILAARWRLTDDQRLTPATRRIRVDLSPAYSECDSGRDAGEAAEAPRFTRRGGRLVITIWVPPVSPPPPGFSYSCERGRQTPLVVELPGRLGSLSLWDGVTYPPREILPGAR